MSYKKRFADDQKQFAYENACDCLYYGYGKRYWNNCGLSEHDAEKVWEKAYSDMCEFQEDILC